MQTQGPILIVDDEPDLRQLLDINLRREGFDTRCVGTAAEATAMLSVVKPCLIVLDWMLPDGPGTDVCKKVRSNPALANVPVIMLTARGEEIDRVVGFEVGADDYVVKSTFSVREFVLRIKAILRRTGGSSPSKEEAINEDEPLVHELLHIDRDGHRAFVSNEEITLTATEFRLLTTLAEKPGRVFSRGTLLQRVWDMPPDINTRTVDTHVKRLREKLGAAAAHLETVRGVGYRFNAKPDQA